METGALGRREAHKRSRIKEAAISRRQNLQEWQVSRPFQTEDMNRFPVIRSGFPMKDIFKLSDDHKALFSIDITTKQRNSDMQTSCCLLLCRCLCFPPLETPDINQASYHKALRPQLTAMPDIQAYFP